RAMIFTGPPLSQADDPVVVQRLLGYEGRKIVCGGASGNLVARCLGVVPEVDIDSMTPRVPPMATIAGIDLVTEGIITMNAALGLMRQSECRPERLPSARDGATMLAREILLADEVFFLVGQKINEFYQNPDLPLNLSLRKSLVNQFMDLLRAHGREVKVEYM
ncbi:MAG: serine/threonine protein phosphatase, partial [Phycisphaeraceae bacterium]|nr:serine/threonine protein phosphatase [Phycisphaeraceae bacterium]